jgi:Holliday junction resolvase RusA-like endonuclease
MDKQISNLIWDVCPVPKPRMTQRDKWLRPPRKPVEDYNRFKRTLEAFSLRDKYVVTNPLSLIFVIQMPASWSNKKRNSMNGQPHTAKPDLDNLIKAFKDALCENDSFIHTYDQMKKVWGVTGAIVIVNNNDKKDTDPTTAKQTV